MIFVMGWIPELSFSRLPTVRGPVSCKEKARALVHKYAAFGTAWAILPIPIATSVGLTALETHLMYWVARIYGESPSSGDIAMTAAGLELASVALKTVAIEGATYVPVIGWGIKASIAGSAIEAIGALAIDHYEKKHPGRMADAG
jgi:uncharacterized protein (DUF697 family)